MNAVDQLVEISREVGRDPEWVLAGGGNTSVKENGLLYIKASGTSLAATTPQSLVKMEMGKLGAIWLADYPTDTREREARALADLMAARAPGEENKRPSVETLMHALLTYRFVVHTHPSLINGVTCGNEGEAVANRLFGGRALWIPTVNPGYVLAQTLKNLVDRFTEANGAAPQIILLQNHGLVVAADSAIEIRSLQAEVAELVRHELKREPDLTPVSIDSRRVSSAEAAVRAVTKSQAVRFLVNAEIARAVADRASLARVMSAYSPDHIVYAGVEPLFLPAPANGGSPAESDIAAAISDYRNRLSADPKVFALQRLGIVGVGSNEAAADNAAQLFLDALKVSIYADSFGGYRFLPADQVRFIRGWEVEQYRSRLGTETR
ncbi:MAG TPA: class II aldolase/adducin family protein [Spirochaetia bacterium]|nr:class II aldolase/adducin family protein [Spirochaetia bacterium]